MDRLDKVTLVNKETYLARVLLSEREWKGRVNMIEYEKEAVLVLEKELSVEELVDQLQTSINWMIFTEGCFAEVLATHSSKTQDSFMLLSVNWIAHLEKQYKEELMDGRNESSVRFGHMLFTSQVFKVLLEDVHGRMEEEQITRANEFAELFGKEHFRIQDTFSEMVFASFLHFTPVSIAESQWKEYFMGI